MATSHTLPGSSTPLRPWQTFADENDRALLTPAALEAVRNLAKTWDATGDEMAILLGMSSSTWGSDQGRRLGPSAITGPTYARISRHRHFQGPAFAVRRFGWPDRWIRLRNSGPLFGNRTPIETMIEGGIPVMIEVRRYEPPCAAGCDAAPFPNCTHCTGEDGSACRDRPLARSVLLKLVGERYLDDLVEIEGATSGRLAAEQQGTEALDARELVGGLPGCKLRQCRICLFSTTRTQSI